MLPGPTSSTPRMPYPSLLYLLTAAREKPAPYLNNKAAPATPKSAELPLSKSPRDKAGPRQNECEAGYKTNNSTKLRVALGREGYMYIGEGGQDMSVSRRPIEDGERERKRGLGPD